MLRLTAALLGGSLVALVLIGSAPVTADDKNPTTEEIMKKLHGKTGSHTAINGVFQLMLTTAKVAQLLRLSLADGLSCVPEISANKYALNIRFIGIAGMDRGSVYDGDFDFELTFCNL